MTLGQRDYVEWEKGSKAPGSKLELDCYRMVPFKYQKDSWEALARPSSSCCRGSRWVKGLPLNVPSAIVAGRQERRNTSGGWQKQQRMSTRKCSVTKMGARKQNTVPSAARALHRAAAGRLVLGIAGLAHWHWETGKPTVLSSISTPTHSLHLICLLLL